MNRRRFLTRSASMVAGLSTGALALGASTGCQPGNESSAEPAPASGDATAEADRPEPFQISLAQWSFHRQHFGSWLHDMGEAGWQEFGRRIADDPKSLLAGPLDPMDFPSRAAELGFEGVEYVNTFYLGSAREDGFFERLRERADAAGVESLLIMCDALGSLGHPDAAERSRVVARHVPWLEGAHTLGCHAVRVNAYSEGPASEQAVHVAAGLKAVCEAADALDLSVLVENHGGLSSDANWLGDVMERVDHPRVGTLPDFGNFLISDEAGEFDRYEGVRLLMPWARAVSAKSYDFDESGDETTIDFARMMNIVRAAGYEGWVGVEYEGRRLDEESGILATRRLLERLREA